MGHVHQVESVSVLLTPVVISDGLEPHVMSPLVPTTVAVLLLAHALLAPHFPAAPVLRLTQALYAKL